MTTRGASVRRRGAAAVCAALALVVVTGCVADPPPPAVVGEERTDGASVTLTEEGLLLALNRVDPGFNPHLLADQGVDTDLVASLLLPSAFVPGPGGERTLNRDLLVSAARVPGAPSTIRYTIDQQAQWSDGVPVAAEDFEYLWRQMTTQPGVVDPAGYERIVEVRSGAGGKVVDVEFDVVPEHWRGLFTHLLPAHILKGAPDGFQGSMQFLPVTSAGPFMVRTADIGRGQIEFVRNDRYWARAPEVDQIVVRRATGAGQLGESLRGGPGVMAIVSANPVAADVAATVPGVTTAPLESAAQLELGLNTVAPAVADPAVRRAVAAAIDPEVVGRIVTREADPSVSSFPFPAGSADTVTADADAVERALGDAGFTRTGTRWRRDGTPLAVTLGVEGADERAVTAAYTVADQLRSAGIGARVWELDATALYADALPHGLVDGVVGWQRTDGRPEVAAVSRFACATPRPPPGRRPRSRPARRRPCRASSRPTRTRGRPPIDGRVPPPPSPRRPPPPRAHSAAARPRGPVTSPESVTPRSTGRSAWRGREVRPVRAPRPPRVPRSISPPRATGSPNWPCGCRSFGRPCFWRPTGSM
ncbi:ABC transporter family substrate-binding protein [Dietzia sp. SL131]|uniref:ABC transporter family substrate-binding protein n=1 Tax=Dietzia sp. SL131 TaxID=2995149 RepID=UPI00227BD11C|nr:ABC transporter family substrate-binding protein [Dietzia sp. SL131]MCY1657292.1 ABC transporter family substrate-binding protein [Dietzia sp. SL131]